MKSKKLFIAVTLSFMSLAAISNVYAHEEYQLSGITVTGKRENFVSELPSGALNRTGVIGILGAKDIMETPFQQNNLSEKTLNRFASDPSQATTSVLVNVPSVRTVSSTLYNDFSIRGQSASAYQMRINGVPGLLSQNNTPSNMFERIEVTSGPGLSITGVQASASPGGIINMVTKRAGMKDSTTYKTYFSGRSTVGNIINFSTRTGANRATGINFNGALISGQTGITNEKVTNKNISLNIDNMHKKSSSNLFISYRDTFTNQAERFFGFTSKDLTRIPKAPDAKNNYTFDGHSLGMATIFGTLNHIQKITDDFNVFMNAGASFNNGYRYLVNYGSRIDILNDKGDFSGTIVNEPYAIRNHYLELGLTKTFNISAIKNELTLSYSKDWYQARWGTSDKAENRGKSSGNLYAGKVSFDKITKNINAAQYYGESEFYGLTAVDTIFFDNVDLMLGFHNHTAAIYSKTGAETKSSATSPFFGFIYKPSSTISLFANHSESFNKGMIVGKDYENSGEILAPNKMKANEIGLKYNSKSMLHSISYFDMQEANYMDSEVNGKRYKTIDGKTKYKGIEYSMTGKLADKLSLTGGFMYIDTEYSKTNDKYLKGKKVQGIADWSSVLTLSYAPNDAVEAWGRLVYTGSAPLYNNERTFSFDPSTTFDLGLTYRSNINTQPVVYNLTVFNLLDSSHWLPRPTRAMGILNQPRAFYFGAEMQI